MHLGSNSLFGAFLGDVTLRTSIQEGSRFEQRRK